MLRVFHEDAPRDGCVIIRVSAPAQFHDDYKGLDETDDHIVLEVHDPSGESGICAMPIDEAYGLIDALLEAIAYTRDLEKVT